MPKQNLQQNKTTSKLPLPKPKTPKTTQPTQDVELAAVIQRAQDTPASLTPYDMTQLQHSLGNQAVGQFVTSVNQHQLANQNKPSSQSSQASPQRLLARHTIQAKLAVNVPNDQYEQEADAVAKQVVTAINTPTPQTPTTQRQEDEDDMAMTKPAATAQRQEEDELAMAKPINHVQRQEDDELAMMKSIGTIQRQEEDELAMAKPEIQRIGYDNSGAVDESIETDIRRARGNGQPLADSIRAPMEQNFGADFSSVKIHTDSQSNQLNQAVQAKAFTTGQDIFFRHGEYNPGTQGGQELIAHELTHVVQQGAAPAASRTVMQRSAQPSITKTVTPPSIQRKLVLVPSSGPLAEQNLSDLNKIIGDYDGEALVKSNGEIGMIGAPGPTTIGWQLLARMIEHAKVVVIGHNEERYGPGLKNRVLDKDGSHNPLVGSDSEVSMPQEVDMADLVKDVAGTLMKEATERHIILAHELIHADRAQRGHKAKGAGFHDVTGIWKGEAFEKKGVFAMREELETVGLLMSETDPEQITENMIRAQLGKNLRAAYDEKGVQLQGL